MVKLIVHIGHGKTGSSSIQETLLSKLPFDVIKIDQQFVRALEVRDTAALRRMALKATT
mgnify:CR=1 FL=1